VCARLTFFTPKKKPAVDVTVFLKMGKKLSGAAKRRKQKEKEEAIAEAAAEIERLKLGPTKLWTGLMLHHKDIFVSHVLPKLNRTDRAFFANVNTESFYLLKYARVVKKSEMCFAVHECSSIATLEMLLDNLEHLWGNAKDLQGVIIESKGNAKDHAWFCSQVVNTNKLEFLKWAREEKKLEWDEMTFYMAADAGNLEMLKYCFANDCPCDKRAAYIQSTMSGNLGCVRFLFDKLKPSRETEAEGARAAAELGHLDILKYFVEERKITDTEKRVCITVSAVKGYLDCVKYLVEEAKTPLDSWQSIAFARFQEQTECLHYLREKGCPEPTDEQYASCVERLKKSIPESARRR